MNDIKDKMDKIGIKQKIIDNNKRIRYYEDKNPGRLVNVNADPLIQIRGPCGEATINLIPEILEKDRALKNFIQETAYTSREKRYLENFVDTFISRIIDRELNEQDYATVMENTPEFLIDRWHKRYLDEMC